MSQGITSRPSGVLLSCAGNSGADRGWITRKIGYCFKADFCGAKGAHLPISGGEGFVGCLVGLAGEEAGDGDVFVEGFPVESAAADAELFALLRRGAEEAGKPCERDAEGSSVAEVDPHAVGVEADLGWANGRIHSMLFRFGLCWSRLLQQFAEGPSVVAIIVGHSGFGMQPEFCFAAVFLDVDVHWLQAGYETPHSLGDLDGDRNHAGNPLSRLQHALRGDVYRGLFGFSSVAFATSS